MINNFDTEKDENSFGHFFLLLGGLSHRLLDLDREPKNFLRNATVSFERAKRWSLKLNIRWIVQRNLVF